MFSTKRYTRSGKRPNRLSGSAFEELPDSMDSMDSSAPRKSPRMSTNDYQDSQSSASSKSSLHDAVPGLHVNGSGNLLSHSSSSEGGFALPFPPSSHQIRRTSSARSGVQTRRSYHSHHPGSASLSSAKQFTTDFMPEVSLHGNASGFISRGGSASNPTSPDFGYRDASFQRVGGRSSNHRYSADLHLSR